MIRKSTIDKFNAEMVATANECKSPDYIIATAARRQYVTMALVAELLNAAKPPMIDDVSEVDLRSDDARRYGKPGEQFDTILVDEDYSAKITVGSVESGATKSDISAALSAARITKITVGSVESGATKSDISAALSAAGIAHSIDMLKSDLTKLAIDNGLTVTA